MLDDPWFNDWRFKIQLCAPFIIAAGLIILAISTLFIDTIWTRPAMLILTIAAVITVLNIIHMLHGYRLHRSGPE